MDRPRDGVRRARRRAGRRHAVSFLLAALGVAAWGCGGTASAPATSTKTAPATSFAWLRDRAEPWNHVLNRDQAAIDRAAAAVSGTAGSQFFARLGAACSKMLADTGRARTIAPAPATSLQQAWTGMLAETATYASDCITVVRSHSDRDLTTWNTSLTAMNQASGVWNTAVNAARRGAHTEAG